MHDEFGTHMGPVYLWSVLLLVVFACVLVFPLGLMLLAAVAIVAGVLKLQSGDQVQRAYGAALVGTAILSIVLFLCIGIREIQNGTGLEFVI